MSEDRFTQRMDIPAPDNELPALVETVAALTGMEISVWCADGHSCGYSGRSPAQLCNLLHGCGLGHALCVGADSEAFRLARETDGVYCYRCPFGLVEAVVPIRQGTRISGFIMAGKVAAALPGSGAEIRRAVLARYPEVGRYFDLDRAIATVPQLTTEQLTDNLRLLTVLAEVVAEKGVTDGGNTPLAVAVRRFLDGNFDRRVTLPELSVRFHCSTVTLNAHFRKAYGASIAKYLNQRRMEQAKELLRKTDMTLGEIADRLGFADADYFSRLFRSQYGISPLGYRNEGRTKA